MEKQKPYISFCIPTYNRLDILERTIDSIYEDLSGVSLDDFEVIVSDNSPNFSAQDLTHKYNYSNFNYKKTVCEGFLNSFYSLSYGSGEYLKLHNNYTRLKAGSLKKMIELVKDNLEYKPVLFFTDGHRLTGDTQKYTSFDSFMYHLSYFSSWSSGFGLWREDYESVKGIEINKMFPQTSLLLTQTNKHGYILEDRILFNDQFVPKKGGYNIFRVFSVEYLSLIRASFDSNQLSKKSFLHIKSDLLYNYIAVRYFKTVVAKIDNFEKDGIQKSILVNYSLGEYYMMILVSLFSPIKHLYRKLRKAKH